MINTKSFDVLRGLILRSTSPERLMVSDEWLRENKVVSVPQYQALRALWDEMNRKYGRFNVVISCGRVKHTLIHDVSYAEALRVCENAGWSWNYNNGCEWDMEID